MKFQKPVPRTNKLSSLKGMEQQVMNAIILSFTRQLRELNRQDNLANRAENLLERYPDFPLTKEAIQDDMEECCHLGLEEAMEALEQLFDKGFVQIIQRSDSMIGLEVWDGQTYIPV